MAGQLAEIPEFEEINLICDIMQVRRRHLRRVRKRYDPFIDLNDEEFRKRYRLSKTASRFVIDLLQDQLEISEFARSDALSPTLQILITLRYYAKGSYQSEIGDIHGVSQATVSKTVAKISRVIASLLPRFINFPARLETLKMDFYNIRQFPNVVGSIDCTHIKIKNPNKEEAMLYCNRKGYYSLNVQVVCDANCKILDVVARWRGSAHDSRIWAECSLKQKFENGEIKGLLLGDGGYPCSSYLLTPLLNPQTAAEAQYNRAHISTRNTIERCFGQWKGMFRALYKGMELSLPTAKAAIVAMAVLYNIRKIHGEEEDYDSDEEVDGGLAVVAHQNQQTTNRGNIFRKEFIRRHFEH